MTSVTIPRAILRVLVIVLLGTALLHAQGRGPVTPPKTPEIVRIPTRPDAEKAPVPEEEIIRKFAEKEEEAARAVMNLTYRKTIRLEELGEDGKPTGRAESVNEARLSDGQRRPRTPGESESTLRYTGLERDVLDVLGRIPLFPLAATQIVKYDIVYQAAEPVDELKTYVFRVTPKRLDRATAYFSGLVWVDDHDFAIVKSYGKWVTEMGDVQLPDLPFTYYETYRQPVMNKFWMPAYMRSDGSVATKDMRVPVRLTVRWDNFAAAASESQPSERPSLAKPPLTNSPGASKP